MWHNAVAKPNAKKGWSCTYQAKKEELHVTVSMFCSV